VTSKTYCELFVIYEILKQVIEIFLKLLRYN